MAQRHQVRFSTEHIIEIPRLALAMRITDRSCVHSVQYRTEESSNFIKSPKNIHTKINTTLSSKPNGVRAAWRKGWRIFHTLAAAIRIHESAKYKIRQMNLSDNEFGGQSITYYAALVQSKLGLCNQDNLRSF